MITRRITDNSADWIGPMAGRLLSAAVVFSSSVASAVYTRGLSVRTRLSRVWADLAATVRVLAEAAAPPTAEEPEGEGEKAGVILGLSGLALALVIGGVAVLCVLPTCVIIVLALLGPAIGNTFSNIIEEI